MEQLAILADERVEKLEDRTRVLEIDLETTQKDIKKLEPRGKEQNRLMR